MTTLRKTAGALLVLATALLLATAALLYTDRLHYEVYLVESNSMAPAVPVGSIVVVDTDADIEQGDVIAFHVGEDVTTHRLIAVNPDGTIVTKGDAVAQADPFVATTDDIIGEVVAVFPHLGPLVVFLSTPAGFGCLTLLVIAGGTLLSLLPGRRRDEPDPDDPDPDDRDPADAQREPAGADGPPEREPAGAPAR